MPMHAEKRKVPYTAAQMNDLVFDVKSYPQFLPWCLDVIMHEQSDVHLRAELVVGYKFLRERFTSLVTREYPHRIHVQYQDGPFHYLNNHWVFEPGESGQDCTIDFFVDFEFKVTLFQKAMQVFFQEAVRVMITAFERRAEALYGKK